MGVIIILCGVGFLMRAGVFLYLNLYRSKNCKVTTSAKVVRIETKNTEYGPHLHPVYEYEVDGQIYSNEGIYWENHVPQIGSEIEVKYNPDDPRKSYILVYDTTECTRMGIKFGVIGIVLVLVGIGMWLFA